MKAHCEILTQKIGPDGRYYQLVRTNDGYAVVSEGYSGKVNGRVRLFEIEVLTLEEAKHYFKQYTSSC
jgi:hypothetical protein